jgi:hypothetical protein
MIFRLSHYDYDTMLTYLLVNYDVFCPFWASNSLLFVFLDCGVRRLINLVEVEEVLVADLPVLVLGPGML